MIVLLSGCATVVRGTTEDVVITSEPSDATITTTLGHSCSASPCVVNVERKKSFTAYAEKPGYEKGSLHIATKVQGKGAAGIAGNLLVGGVIGVGVDAATGAGLDHVPNPAHIKLKKIGADEAGSPAESAPKPAKKKSVPTS